MPSAQEEEETFKGNSNGITLIAPDGKGFVEILA
jgi:hypothetical protein